MRFPAAVVFVVGLVAGVASSLRTSGKVNLTVPQPGQHAVKFLDYYHQTFAFTRRGRFTARLELGAEDVARSCFRLAFCVVTDAVRRDHSYQLKQVVSQAWRQATAHAICGVGDRPPYCTDKPLTRLVSYPDRPGPTRAVVVIKLVACTNTTQCRAAQEGTKRAMNAVATPFRVEMTNADLAYPELGWDEGVYPYAPTALGAMAVALAATLCVGGGVATSRRRAVPLVAKVVFVTAVAKIVSTALTSGAYWRYAISGHALAWFFVLRVPLIVVDEVLIGLLMLVMSTGVGLMPATWHFDRRSSTFAVFLGLALEVFTVITSEVLYMIPFLGLVVFIFSGGTVAFICILYSARNARFLRKYANLVTAANIIVTTTPLPMMERFFHVNAVLVFLVWLFKVVSFAVFDYVVRRPDMLWVVFECADLVLLAWYALAVFPRSNSAYYVNMSNVDNARLHQVNAWRMRHAPLGADAHLDPDLHNLVDDEVLDEEGHIQRMSGDSTRAQAPASDDMPEMIAWHDGDPLPSPNSGMWDEMRRMLKRTKAPDAAPVRVLGSPRGGQDETLALSIAKPVIGPGTEKRPHADLAIPGGPYPDRMRTRAQADSTTERSGMASRELSALSDADDIYSVPSSNASADGEIFGGSGKFAT